jgi:copper chaperone CopZ
MNEQPFAKRPHRNVPDPDAQSERDERKRADIAVAGLASAEDASVVEAALRGTPGVKDARANGGQGSVTVTYDPRATGIPTLHESLRRAGYNATGPAHKPHD